GEVFTVLDDDGNISLHIQYCMDGSVENSQNRGIIIGPDIDSIILDCYVSPDGMPAEALRNEPLLHRPRQPSPVTRKIGGEFSGGWGVCQDFRIAFTNRWLLRLYFFYCLSGTLRLQGQCCLPGLLFQSPLLFNFTLDGGPYSPCQPFILLL